MTHSRNTANPTVVNRRQALAGAGAAAGALALTCPAMADVPKTDKLAKRIRPLSLSIKAGTD